MKNLPQDIIRMAVISYNTKYLTRFEVLSAVLLMGCDTAALAG